MANASPPSAPAQGPPASTSIQFDEASLASHSHLRRARTPSSTTNGGSGSAMNAASPQSRIVGLPTAAHAPPYHQHNRSSTPSTSASVQGSTLLQRPRNTRRRKVVTTPAWARSEDDDDDGGGDAYDTPTPNANPIASTSYSAATASPRSSTLPSPPRLKPTPAPTTASCKKSAAQKEEEAAASAGLPAHAGQAADGDLKGPARFWTFSLPTKYRNRLHEHHLRQLERDLIEKSKRHARRNTDEEDGDGGIDGERSDGESGSSSSSSSSSNGSNGSSGSGGNSSGEDDAPPTGRSRGNSIVGQLGRPDQQGQSRNRTRTRTRTRNRNRRSSAGGLGDAHASAGAAAGMVGADSLVSWRRRQQQGAGAPMSPISPRAETSPDDSSGAGVGRHVDEHHGSNGDYEYDYGGDDEEKALTRERGRERGRDSSPGYSPGYSYSHSHSHSRSHSGDDVEMAERSGLPATTMRVPIPPASLANSDNSFDITRHQARTPGWESPWRPESMHGHGAINIGGYTFATGNGGADAFFPRTDTRRSGTSGAAGGSKRRRRQSRRSAGGKGQGGSAAAAAAAAAAGGSTHHAASAGAEETWLRARWEWWKVFLMRNPFVPLLFRITNLSFTTATLAVAIRLWRVLHSQGAANSVGSSPVVGIVFAPLSLVHVGTQVWLDYFSRPIGLWKVKSKLSYQLVELVFISLWSALLSLTFDNLATSSLGCVYWYDAYPTCGATGQPELTQLRDPAKKPTICALQKAFIGLTFVTLVAYVTVFIISIYRTVNR